MLKRIAVRGYKSLADVDVALQPLSLHGVGQRDKAMAAFVKDLSGRLKQHAHGGDAPPILPSL